MTTEFENKWSAKIAKLFAIADDPNIGAEERDAFLSKANKLMVEYKIEWIKVEEARGRTFQDKAKIETFWGPEWPKGEDAAWRRMIFGAVANIMFCEVLVADRSERAGRCAIIGTRNDISIAMNVFDRVIKWLERDCMKAYIVANMHGQIQHVGRVNANNWRQTFKASAAVAIVQRAYAMITERAKAPDTKAIVLVVRNEIQEYINENYDIRKETSDADSIKRRVDDEQFDDAAARGYESGRNVPIVDELRTGNDTRQPREDS